jgi:hypothetical protein
LARKGEQLQVRKGEQLQVIQESKEIRRVGAACGGARKVSRARKVS